METNTDTKIKFEEHSLDITPEAQRAVTSARGVTFKRAETTIPYNVKKLFRESKKYFKNQLAEFVYLRTYARWIEDEGRRETWIETVDRYVDFMRENLGKKLTEEEYAEVREAILNQEAMPSMRLLQFAGNAVKKTNVCAYNCSFIAPTKLKDFAEIMYILMCGTGVGYTVERIFVEALPQIRRQKGEVLDTYIVPDSREGWADTLYLGLKTWYAGKDILFDFSQIRPCGARLNTMGGYASGPEPLRALLEFARQKVLSRQGRRLDTLDVHDLICKIGEVVVAGGVRRSALISLSDLDDASLRSAKVGQFWNTHPERSMANNSAVYEEKPNIEQFMDEWLALIKSSTGERGLFNRGGLRQTLPARRLKVLKEKVDTLGTNPCGEILLQPKQFCNLSEVVAREKDTEETLLKKIKIASLLGTYQSTLVNFPYLSKDWKKNCEEERLLGVSITGQWDCEAVRTPDTMAKLKKHAVKMNKQYAERFGIGSSTCVTCVKPSGNLSQTVHSSSGLHPRYAPYYIRRVRIADHDPLFLLLKDQGVPYFPEVGQSRETATTWVVEFPVKSPDNAVCKDNISAIEQLEYWKMLKENFTEHNPSVTVYVGEDEWLEVANWVYKNWDIVGGISFLPRSNHVYSLSPYEEITRERFVDLEEKIGHIDFSKIVSYEKVDSTENSREVACAGGQCEL